MRASAVDAALRQLATRIAEATAEAAQARRAEGKLEFHDLLVLARDLLTGAGHGAAVRDALHQQYRRLLLDEFQDTDPIQIELAVRIAAGRAGGAADWADVPVPPGRLFLVGDPKQSIYRFRRADIATYLRAQQRIGDPVILAANFRTTEPVLAWINHVFGQLISAEDGSQPAYIPLQACRAGRRRAGPAVVVLGAGIHPGKPSAAELRAREAADVARAVHAAIAERWQVADQRHPAGGPTGPCWRDVRLNDIAVLVPARTILPYLENALDAAGIAYRAEASSLVYRTREVRDLLMAARAADDPSDALALVTALRSPLFGCGDDDLWTWHHAGGRWNILAPVPEHIPAGHPVLDAVSLPAAAAQRPDLARSQRGARPPGRRPAHVRGRRRRPAGPGRLAAAAVRHRPGPRLVRSHQRRTARLPDLGRRARARKQPAPPRRYCRKPTPTRCGS